MLKLKSPKPKNDNQLSIKDFRAIATSESSLLSSDYYSTSDANYIHLIFNANLLGEELSNYLEEFNDTGHSEKGNFSFQVTPTGRQLHLTYMLSRTKLHTLYRQDKINNLLASEPKNEAQELRQSILTKTGQVK
ncbi:hypothetical protein [Hymenobacter sublimis]|uniref:Uncharacterized protein n=1 Tax=Hymenobacter sublimis TaxID=2933777 RepID=A0ABY4JCK1_9BACT|nr:hypothetical protein [Hymenobacter sublimis]UPL50542.1 hypothetical protein MWH26_06445 [Hymenobacter sublimis]